MIYIFINKKGEIGHDNDRLPTAIPDGIKVQCAIEFMKNGKKYSLVLKFSGVPHLKFIKVPSPLGILRSNDNDNINDNSTSRDSGI